MIIDPPQPNALADQQFGAVIGASNPQLTGWPVWLDARTSGQVENRPTIKNNVLEYLVLSSVEGWINHVDFARLNPVGEFFLHRVLQDDGAPSQVKPLTVLDPLLMVLRVAEVMAVGIAFAKALGWDPQTTKLGFCFRWSGLSGRSLTSWWKPFAGVDGGRAHDNEITSFVEFSLDTPVSALGQFVDEATRHLFIAFDGARIPMATIEDLVKRLVERRVQ